MRIIETKRARGAAGSAALTAAAALAVAAGTVAVMAWASAGGKQGVDPRYATPTATLKSYIRAVLAVDEQAEMDTATKERRAAIEAYRSPQGPARRRRGLAGKAELFRVHPIRIVEEKIWGDRAKVLVTQGGTASCPLYYVYAFKKEDGAWKIDRIDQGGDLRW